MTISRKNITRETVKGSVAKKSIIFIGICHKFNNRMVKNATNYLKNKNIVNFDRSKM